MIRQPSISVDRLPCDEPATIGSRLVGIVFYLDCDMYQESVLESGI